jgi:hypothetical protein
MNTKQKLKIGNRESYFSAAQIRVAMQLILKLQEDTLKLDDDHAENARLSLEMISWMQMLMADDVDPATLNFINKSYDVVLFMIEARRRPMKRSRR